MSAKETKQKENKTPFYKRASFPWFIIIISSALLIGVMTGWTLRSHDNARVTAEAYAIASSLEKK